MNFVCDNDWVLFRAECYYFGPVRNQSLKTWYDANDFCKSSGANLVVIGDPYEMSFITGMYSQKTNMVMDRLITVCNLVKRLNQFSVYNLGFSRLAHRGLQH